MPAFTVEILSERRMSSIDDLIPLLEKVRLSGVLQSLELRTRQAVDDDLSHGEFLTACCQTRRWAVVCEPGGAPRRKNLAAVGSSLARWPIGDPLEIGARGSSGTKILFKFWI